MALYLYQFQIMNCLLDLMFFFASHDYPNRYPPYAYVLWTFHPADDLDGSNVVLEISFGDVYLERFDHLTLGLGSDPHNSTNLIYSYEYYSDYTGYPRTLLLEARNIFVEFNSTDYRYDLYRLGFQIQITVRENLGKQSYFIVQLLQMRLHYIK